MQGPRPIVRHWLPVIVWTAIIFIMSTGLGAPRTTSRFIVPLLTWLFPDISAESLLAVRFAVRKVLHVLEYAILTGLIWRAMFRPTAGDSRPWNWRPATQGWFLAVAYAATDEWHQMFVPGRHGTITDVLFDATGAAMAIMALHVWWRYGRAKPHRPDE